MPDARFFIDTNILLYAHDRRDPAKEQMAKTWLNTLAKRQAAFINLQVLNELTYVLLRKKWFDDAQVAFAVVDAFSELGDSPVTTQDVRHARRIHASSGYSWWDCLLLACALERGCNYFLSEDLQDRQDIEGLTIIDPFAHSPDQIPISR